MSYFDGGACGYIATAMLLLWHDYTNNGNIINTNSSTGVSYTTTKTAANGIKYPVFNGNPSTYTDGKTFSYNIWRWHSGTSSYSSTAYAIAPTVKSYMASKGVSYTSVTNTLPLTGDVVSFLNTYKSPYVLFGLLKRTGGSYLKHAVLAYGYTLNYISGTTSFDLICNFGHASYSNVYVSGTWGTGYGIKSVS